MKTKCYYNFKWSQDIENILIKHKVNYKKVECKGIQGSVISYPDMLNFTINKEDKAYSLIKEYLPKPNTCWLEFSEKELKEAKWLYMRSTNMKINVENDAVNWLCPNNSSADKKSMFHMKQIKAFEIKPVKWNSNNHFYSSYVCGYDVIFCDSFAMDFIKQNNLTGVEFCNVIWHKKNQILPSTYQIECTSVLPESAFVFDENCKIEKCPTCQKSKYEVNHEFRIKIKKEYLRDNQDFYTTQDIFSIGNVASYTIVSNRVYSLLKKAKMTRNLKFEPVIII